MNHSTMSCLDAGQIQAQLIPEAAMQIDRLTVLQETESTNTWVKQQPEPGVIACLTEAQTAGRGRRGRVWLSPPGTGVLMSLRWPLKVSAETLSTLSLQVGLAVQLAIEQGTGLPVKLKWPNDVMLKGQKLGGILVELQSSVTDDGQPITTVIIGIGLNVLWPDGAEMPQPLADCRDAESPVSRNALAAAILSELTIMFNELESQSACGVVARWWQHDMLANQMVTVQQGEQQFCGRAIGITGDGGFVVETDAGIQTFYSSEVSIRRQHSVE